jgi:hypothetical protein
MGQMTFRAMPLAAFEAAFFLTSSVVSSDLLPLTVLPSEKQLEESNWSLRRKPWSS